MAFIYHGRHYTPCSVAVSITRRTNAMETGSISHGTLRTEDLLEAFADTLAYLTTDIDNKDARTNCEKLIAEARTIDPNEEQASYVLDDLFNALDYYAPEGTYFGAHPGDGSDFGFWAIEIEEY